MAVSETKRPRIYVETTIPSYLTSRPTTDVRSAANRAATIEWWSDRKQSFDLFISEFVVAEASMGDRLAANRRLKSIEGIPQFEVTEEVRGLGKWLIERGVIPVRCAIDSFHIATAAVHGMDYLLTWNCSHIANAAIRSQIEAACRERGCEPPIICTPLELMEE